MLVMLWKLCSHYRFSWIIFQILQLITTFIILLLIRHHPRYLHYWKCWNHFSYRLFNFFLIFQAIVTFFDVNSYFSEYNFFSPWFLFKVLVGTMLFRCLISIIFLKPRLSQQENDRIIKQKWQNNYFDYSHFCNYKTYWNMWTYLIVF